VTIAVVALATAVWSYPYWLEGFAGFEREVAVSMATSADVSRVEVCSEAPTASTPCSRRLDVMHAERATQWNVSIEYLAKRDAEAKGSEVWLFDLSAGARQADLKALLPGSNGWEARSDSRAPNNVVLVAYAGRPAGLSAQLRGGTLRLRFLKHAWSGWVRVNANHETRTIDLYSPATTEENLYFQPPVTGDNTLTPPKEYRLDVPKSRSDYGYIHFRPAPDGQIRLVSAVVDGHPADIRDGRTIVLPKSGFAPARCALMAAILTAILLASLLIAASDLCRRHPRLPIWVLPVAASLSMSLLWAAICYPANLSNDSLDMLHQATTGNYHDWHPIGLTLCERAIYSSMASFPLHVTVAASAVTTGFLFWLAISATLYGVITPRLARLAGLVATFAYYPLWMYGPTLQKDVWFAICFIPLSLQAYKALRSPKAPFLRLLLVTALLFGALLGRQSALVSYLCLLILLWSWRRLFCRRSVAPSAITGLLLVALVAPIAQSIVYKRLRVQPDGNFQNLYFLYDLVGTMHFTNKPADRFRHLQVYQIVGPQRLQRALSQYACTGNMEYLIFGSDPPFPISELMTDSYTYADLVPLAAQFPSAYLQHKSCVLAPLLGITGSAIYYPFQRGVGPNNWRLRHTSLLPKLEQAVDAGFLGSVTEHPSPLQWPFRHYIVLLTALALCVGCVLLRGRARGPTSHEACQCLWLGGLAVLAPLVVTAPVPDWRYLMPATALWMLSACTAIARGTRLAAVQARRFRLRDNLTSLFRRRPR
jgi:hypothetical protein